MHLPDLRDKQGFTLIELMISIAILGILTATTLPLANAYRLRAEKQRVITTLRYLMDGIETHYIDTNELFPEVTLPPSSFVWEDEQLIVNEGEQKAIPELSYTFQQGHKYKYTFYRTKVRIKVTFKSFSLDWDWDRAEIIVETDFDYDRDGTDDIYTAYMWLDHDQPLDGWYRNIVST